MVIFTSDIIFISVDLMIDILKIYLIDLLLADRDKHPLTYLKLVKVS